MIEAQGGTRVRAAATGIVSHITSHYPGVGPAVMVTHPDGMSSFYGPLTLREGLREGDTVMAGEELGRMGAGPATAPVQLRFRVLRGNDDVPDVIAFLQDRAAREP